LLACRTAEEALCRSPIYYIPPRPQPQTPTGQSCLNIGHQLASRPDYKPQQPFAIVDLTSSDAPALRPKRFCFFLRCSFCRPSR
jgi:hypothetical protein